jgi:hypothetical protein
MVLFVQLMEQLGRFMLLAHVEERHGFAAFGKPMLWLPFQNGIQNNQSFMVFVFVDELYGFLTLRVG